MKNSHLSKIFKNRCDRISVEIGNDLRIQEKDMVSYEIGGE